MKKYRKEKQFLDQLRTIPNISLACEKLGLSRQTIYRWRQENPEFGERLEEALNDGIESISDLAESKLISNINSGSMRAIEYWLGNNKKKYVKPRIKDFFDGFHTPVERIEVNILHPNTPNFTTSARGKLKPKP